MKYLKVMVFFAFLTQASFASAGITPEYLKLLNNENGTWALSYYSWGDYYISSLGCIDDTNSNCYFWYTDRQIMQNYAADVDGVKAAFRKDRDSTNWASPMDWDFVEAARTSDCGCRDNWPFVYWNQSSITEDTEKDNSGFYSWLNLTRYLEDEQYTYYCSTGPCEDLEYPLVRMEYNYVGSSTTFEKQLGVFLR